MRQIKFRAQDIASNKWLYGDLRHHKDDVCIFEQGGNKGEQVKHDTIGQFVGLKDKNGKEIYEGDILRVKEYENLLIKEFIDDNDKYSLFTLEDAKGELRDEYVTPVVWNEGCFDLSTNGSYFNMFVSCIFGNMKRSSPLFEFEIIGNIYENADLIPHKLLAYINK